MSLTDMPRERPLSISPCKGGGVSIGGCPIFSVCLLQTSVLLQEAARIQTDRPLEKLGDLTVRWILCKCSYLAKSAHGGFEQNTIGHQW